MVANRLRLAWRLLLDGDEAIQGFREVGQVGERSNRRIERSGRRVNRVISEQTRRLRTLVGVFVTGYALNAVRTSISETSRLVAEQGHLADSFRSTTRGLQILIGTGERVAVQFEQIRSGVGDFTRRLAQAADGVGPARAALDRLGLSASQLLALDLDERIELVTRAIRGLANEDAQLAVAGNLFGEEGSQNILRVGDAVAEARQELIDIGIALSDIDNMNIEELGNSLDVTGQAFMGVGQAITAELAPALLDINEELQMMISDNLPQIRTLVGEVADVFEEWGAEGFVLAARIAGLATSVGLLYVALNQVARHPILATLLGLSAAVASFADFASEDRIAFDPQRGYYNTRTGETLTPEQQRVVSGVRNDPSFIRDSGASILRGFEDDARAQANENVRLRAQANFRRGRVPQTSGGFGLDFLQNPPASPDAIAQANEDVRLRGISNFRSNASVPQLNEAIGQSMSIEIRAFQSRVERDRSYIDQYLENIETAGEATDRIIGQSLDRTSDLFGDWLRGRSVDLGDFFNDILVQFAQSGLNNIFGTLVGAAFGGLTNPSTGFLGLGVAAPGTFSTATFAGSFHQGGMAGKPTEGRWVPSSLFRNAPRLHEGGFPLARNESPAILRNDELVLNPAQTRMFRQTGGGGVINYNVTINAENATPGTVSSLRSFAEGPLFREAVGQINEEIRRGN